MKLKTIPQIARELDMPVSTLRYTLSRFDVQPSLTAGGRSFFDDTGIQRIREAVRNRSRSARRSCRRQTVLGAVL